MGYDMTIADLRDLLDWVENVNKDLLREYRRSKMSKYRLAKLTGIGQSTIGRWVRGEVDLRISNAEKIAKALGLKVRVEK